MKCHLLSSLMDSVSMRQLGKLITAYTPGQQPSHQHCGCFCLCKVFHLWKIKITVRICKILIRPQDILVWCIMTIMNQVHIQFRDSDIDVPVLRQNQDVAKNATEYCPVLFGKQYTRKDQTC